MTLLGVSVAVARVRSLASLSPPDIAFFHQASWSATRGMGFAQTALEFDAGTLFGSIHLSLVRVLWVPVHALLPRVETLVALQAGVTIGGCMAAASLLAPQKQQSRLPWLMLAGASPVVLALSACDLRPIVFLVAPALLTIAGLQRHRALWVVAGSAGVLLAREEGWMVLLAMVPFALVRSVRERSGWTLAGLIGGITLGLMLPQLVWGHGGNIRANTDPAGTWAALLSGARPWIRWPVEWWFALRVLVAAWPAVRCLELLLPALLGWLWLSVFSELEPAAPAHGGLHYLAVVAPLVVGAALVGLLRVHADSPPHRWKFWRVLALASLVAALPELGSGLSWMWDALHPSPLAQEVAHLRNQPGGVLTVSKAAPLLSGRRLLRIQGHFSAAPTRIEEVATEVDHALLSAERPAGGPPADEWDAWQKALPAAGLQVHTTVEGIHIWHRSP